MKISLRKDGRYGCQIRTPDGKYKTVYGKTNKECRQNAYDLVAEIEDGNYVKPDSKSFETWANDWKDGYLIGVKESTKKNYEGHLNAHIIPYFGAKKLQAIKKLDVQKFITMLVKEKNLAPKTVNNINWTLHKCFDDAIKAELINSNPSDNVTLPKKVKPEMYPLSEDDLKDFMALIEGKRHERIYKFLLITGLRISELSGLTTDRVDLVNNKMLIDRQLARVNEVSWTTPKHDKIRSISLSPSAIELIKQEKKHQAENKLKSGDATFNSHHFVFIEDDGRPITVQAPYANLKKITAGTQFEKLRVHDLRHTYAVLSLQAGIDIKTLQENLGHHSAAFTLDQYAFVTDGMKKRAAEKFEKYVNLYVKSSTPNSTH